MFDPKKSKVDFLVAAPQEVFELLERRMSASFPHLSVEHVDSWEKPEIQLSCIIGKHPKVLVLCTGAKRTFDVTRRSFDLLLEPVRKCGIDIPGLESHFGKVVEIQSGDEFRDKKPSDGVLFWPENYEPSESDLLGLAMFTGFEDTLKMLALRARPALNHAENNRLVSTALSFTPSQAKEEALKLTGNETTAKACRWLAIIWRDFRDCFPAIAYPGKYKNPLFNAVEGSDVRGVIDMLDETDKPCAVGLHGCTLLGLAVKRCIILGHDAVCLNILKMLLGKGLDPDVRDVDGRTPAFDAAENGSRCILEIFIEHGAHLDVADNYGVTLAHAASVKGFSLDGLGTQASGVASPTEGTE